MPRTRTFALVLIVIAATIGALQQSSVSADVLPTVDLSNAATYTLVEGWCSEACDDECARRNSACQSATAVGCTCFWLCENGDDGESYCGGAIGVKICNLR